jgi:predicted transcriptional regulator
MTKLITLIRWEWIRYGYQNMVHVSDIAELLGCSEATVLRIAREFKIRRPGGKRVRRRSPSKHRSNGPRQFRARRAQQLGAIASNIAQREPAPITLAGPEWSWPKEAA